MTVPFPLAELMLTNQIRENLDYQIKKMINCFDLSQIEIGICSDNLDVSEFQYVQIAEQQIVWEEIAKLSINFILDYEYNKQFTFENRYDTDEYKKRLVNLGFIFKNSRWKSVRKPNVRDVQTNMFMYFLYRLIANKMTLSSAIEQNKENERRHLQQNLGPENSSRSVEVEIEGSKNVVNEDMDFRDSDSDKWKCAICGLCNEYLSIKCVACEGLYKKETWTCGHCTMKNNCVNDACETCGKRNIATRDDQNMLVTDSITDDGDVGCDSVKQDKETHIPENEWKCASCGVRQSYEFSVCGMCPRIRSIDGLWMCGMCTYINKCYNERCDVCNEWNKFCRLCQYCKKNKVPPKEVRCVECAKIKNIRWRCPHRNCDSRNDDTDEYCWKCQLSRHNSQNRGAEGKQWYQGKERKVWVCYKCDTVNELSCKHCSKFTCVTTRYEKIKCIHCRTYNDYVSNFCCKCYKQL